MLGSPVLEVLEASAEMHFEPPPVVFHQQPYQLQGEGSFGEKTGMGRQSGSIKAKRKQSRQNQHQHKHQHHPREPALTTHHHRGHSHASTSAVIAMARSLALDTALPAPRRKRPLPAGRRTGLDGLAPLPLSMPMKTDTHTEPHPRMGSHAMLQEDASRIGAFAMRLQGHARDLKDLNYKHKRCAKALTFSIKHAGPKGLQHWVRGYTGDRSLFASKAKWAHTKLTEAQQVVSVGGLPEKALAAIAAHNAFCYVDRMELECGHARHALDVLCRSIFVPPKPTAQCHLASFPSSARFLVREGGARDPEAGAASGGAGPRGAGDATRAYRDSHPCWMGDSDMSVRDQLLCFLALETYFDRCRGLETKLDGEASLLPRLMSRLEAQQRERAVEKRMFTRIARKWGLCILWKVLQSWQLHTQDAGKKKKLGKFFEQMTGVRTRVIFQRWRSEAKQGRWRRSKEGVSNVEETLKRMKDRIKKARDHTRDLSTREESLHGKVSSLKARLAELQGVLQDPARQPKSIHATVQALHRSIAPLHAAATDMYQIAEEEVFREGRDCWRLRPLFRYKGVEAVAKELRQDPSSVPCNIVRDERVRHSSPEVSSPAASGQPPRVDDPLRCLDGDRDDDVNADVDEEVRRWRPGQLNSTEATPAFDPLQTTSGRRVRRWANNALRVAWDRAAAAAAAACADTDTDTEPRKNTEAGEEGGEEEEGRGEAGRVVDGLTPPCLLYEDFACLKSASFLALLHGSPELLPGRPRRRSCAVDTHRTEEQSSTQTLARETLRLLPPVARHLEVKHVTGVEDPPTEEELERQRIRQRRLDARNQELGIVVHVMSNYMGQRVHVQDTSPQRLFACLAEWSTMRGPGGGAAGEEGQSWGEAGERRWFGNVQAILVRDSGAVLKLCRDLSEKGHMSMTHERLGNAGKQAMDAQELAGTMAGHLGAEWEECWRDREAYQSHTHDLVRVCWQSLCTTILSRRLRVEEDIDDGTYTTVERVQLERELKRLGTEEEGAQQGECDAIKGLFKARIRDLKRIFAFYAASGDGPATSMDHTEFWRFVKDCKLQKDRKALPSVRVDLIFQQCNLDMKLEGKERTAADDGELEPQEFVEGIARLGAYRYHKGLLSARTARLMDDDILPNACCVSTDVFRERLAGDAVANVYQKHKRNLKVIFKEYAADNDTDAGALSMDTIDAGELVSFAREMNLIGALISEKAVRTLFAYVQQEEEEIEEGEEDSGDSEMVFAEFNEALAAIASYRQPDPYNVIDMRLDMFLKGELMPKAKSLSRLKNKGLK